MRRISTLLFLSALIPAQAQLLLNGSFENALNQGDLSYWTHNCIAQSAADAAPGAGNWSAEVEATNPQGCLGAWLYQVVPSAYDGMPFFLGGWCRNTSGPFVPNIGIDLGIMAQGGTITALSLIPLASDTLWHYLSVTDTLHLGANEQAVVICNSGFVGGPAFSLSRFDGIEFNDNTSTGVDDQGAFELPWYLDVAAQQLFVSLEGHRLFSLEVFDATGRALGLPSKVSSGRAIVDLGDATSGLLLVRVVTDAGSAVIRFVTR